MEEMSSLCCTYSQIMCAKPHSADVEIIISANNLLRSVHRNRMKIETEYYKLFIHYNMPDLENWNTIHAILALLFM